MRRRRARARRTPQASGCGRGAPLTSCLASPPSRSATAAPPRRARPRPGSLPLPPARVGRPRARPRARPRPSTAVRLSPPAPDVEDVVSGRDRVLAELVRLFEVDVPALNCVLGVAHDPDRVRATLREDLDQLGPVPGALHRRTRVSPALEQRDVAKSAPVEENGDGDDRALGHERDEPPVGVLEHAQRAARVEAPVRGAKAERDVVAGLHAPESISRRYASQPGGGDQSRHASSHQRSPASRSATTRRPSAHVAATCFSV